MVSGGQAAVVGNMKLMSMLATNESHLLFLDTSAFGYLTQGETPEEIFAPLTLDGETVYGIPISRTIFAETPYGEYLEDMQVYIRLMADPEKEQLDYDRSLALLEAITLP